MDWYGVIYMQEEISSDFFIVQAQQVKELCDLTSQIRQTLTLCGKKLV